MDEIRLDLISKHINEMDSGLVDMIKRFTEFTKREKPRIAVICSDNRLRMTMEQLFTVRTDIDAAVCTINSEEDNIYDLMLTDAAVAVTNALQIAPEGLYGTLKKLSEVSKEIYVLLGGWDSMPKTPEMLASKSERVPEEFPLSKIVSVSSFYSKKLDGFLLEQEAVDKCADHTLISFKRQHSAQSESLYSWLKKSIADFYADCNRQIDKEVLMTINSSRKLAAKQGRYELAFTHSAVSMHNLAELASKRMSDITVDELDEACGGLDSMARGDIRSAQRSAKRALAQLLLKALDSCIGDTDNPVRIKSQATADDCISEMEIINADIQNAVYISTELKEKISKEVGDTTDLDKIVNKYDEIAQLTLKRARERIPAVVNSYRYTLKPDLMVKARETGDSLLNLIKNRNSDSESIRIRIADDDPLKSLTDAVSDVGEETADNSVGGSSNEKADPNNAKVDCFFADTEKMITECISGASNVIYECGKEVAAEINEYSAQMLKGYFGRISAHLEHIGKYLEALHDSYILE